MTNLTKSENVSYEDLRGDGQIVIYKCDDSSNYYVRLKVFDQNGDYKFRVRSLKTKDRNQALTAAFNNPWRNNIFIWKVGET